MKEDNGLFEKYHKIRILGHEENEGILFGDDEIIIEEKIDGERTSGWSVKWAKPKSMRGYKKATELLFKKDIVLKNKIKGLNLASSEGMELPENPILTGQNLS